IRWLTLNGVQILTKLHFGNRRTGRAVIGSIFLAMKRNQSVSGYFLEIVIIPFGPGGAVFADKVVHNDRDTFIKVISNKVSRANPGDFFYFFELHDLIDLIITNL